MFQAAKAIMAALGTCFSAVAVALEDDVISKDELQNIGTAVVAVGTLVYATRNRKPPAP